MKQPLEYMTTIDAFGVQIDALDIVNFQLWLLLLILFVLGLYKSIKPVPAPHSSEPSEDEDLPLYDLLKHHKNLSKAEVDNLLELLEADPDAFEERVAKLRSDIGRS
ncbi:hypothetical protein [cf. Phormidesmis sp. LEGE 11477]|uniref:hypothetical protein n=1 Tax=cf. Phormidesmis sp. LEGE 11477 TaxID=1828680 RepID=UPI001881B8E3|nr:hypothetical protein [cf. Phormidesmis sp. LEGE 11477]MBE9064049.1 hypothetical protein [cf. Phormidesmis sp. LEGE 11477]